MSMMLVTFVFVDEEGNSTIDAVLLDEEEEEEEPPSLLQYGVDKLLWFETGDSKPVSALTCCRVVDIPQDIPPCTSLCFELSTSNSSFSVKSRLSICSGGARATPLRVMQFAGESKGS